MIGKAWGSLASQLAEEVRRLDPSARVRPRIDSSGLLRLAVDTERQYRIQARILARDYEGRATAMCEACGEPTSAVGANVVLTLLCPDCSRR